MTPFQGHSMLCFACVMLGSDSCVEHPVRFKVQVLMQVTRAGGQL